MTGVVHKFGQHPKFVDRWDSLNGFTNYQSGKALYVSRGTLTMHMEYAKMFESSICPQFRRYCPVSGQCFYFATPEWQVDSSQAPDAPVISPLYFLQQRTSQRKTWHINHVMNHPKPETSYLSRKAKYHLILYWTIHQFLVIVIERLGSTE